MFVIFYLFMSGKGARAKERTRCVSQRHMLTIPSSSWKKLFVECGLNVAGEKNIEKMRFVHGR